MIVRGLKVIEDCKRIHADSAGPLDAWVDDASAAQWTKMQDIKNRFPQAKVINASRVVFKIKGNSYRLVAAINFPARIVLVRFVGTHAEYDRIDVETI